MRNGAWRVSFSATSASAQTVAEIDFVSVGRAWPLAADIKERHMTGATVRATFGPPGQRSFPPDDPRRDPETAFIGAARNGETPPGIGPLEVDLFTTNDFYKDRHFWSHPRSLRCNSLAALEDLWGGNRAELMGEDPLGTAPWGYCDRDYPR